MECAATDQQAMLRLAENVEGFLTRLRTSVDTLSIVERQKILRPVVKEILVDRETIKIKHAIPVPRSNTPVGSPKGWEMPGYLLRSGSHLTALWPGPLSKAHQTGENHRPHSLSEIPSEITPNRQVSHQSATPAFHGQSDDPQCAFP